MSDFSLTTLFVVPVGNTLPSSGSTQDLTAGQFGIFKNDYTVATAVNIAAAPYFYLAQGRTNTYLQGSKRSDKIAASNVTEWYKVTGNATATVQITEVSSITVKPGDTLSLTVRAHSSYIDTLYFNGLTKSVTINAPCLDCGGDPCTDVDAETIVDEFLAALALEGPGINPDNSTLNDFFTFAKSGTGASAKLVITGKALTSYGQPCDIAANPYEYDRMYFRAFVYAGAATTADFLVSDACQSVATVANTQEASYPTGSSSEIEQLEKNYYSYQAGYLKSLYRMNGYNQNFESWVTAGTTYDTYYVKFNSYDKADLAFSNGIQQDSSVIIASPAALSAGIEAILVAALGNATDVS